MSDSPAFPIQEAVYQRLTGDTPLMNQVTGVFDHVPENIDHPYVVIGEAIETPDNSHTEFGRETVITLHVWSKFRGMSEALKVVRRIIDLLDHQPLVVEDHHHVATRYEFSQTLRDPNPDLRHIPVRFRVTTEKETTP